MKASGSNLPAEILLSIFDHLKDSPDAWLINEYLCQCRLVCKAWHQSATEAVFSQKHRFTSQSAMIKFYDHLSANPSLAYKIKHLELELHDDRKSLDMAFHKRFFELVLTPATVSLTGSFDPKLIALLAKHFQANQQHCNNIEQLPTLSYIGFDENLFKMLFYCKNSLKAIEVEVGRERRSIQPLVALLPEMKQLNECTLAMHCQDYVLGMEYVLKGCPRISSLVVDDYVGFTCEDAMEEDKCHNFLERHVKKTKHKMKIITNISRPDVLQYLAFKFTNIKYLRASGFQREFGEAIRSLDTIRHIGKLDLQDWDLFYKDEIELFITTMKNRFNKVHLQFNHSKWERNCRLLADASKDVKSKTSSFSLNFSQDTTQEMVEEVLLSLKTVTEYHLVIYSPEKLFVHRNPRERKRREFNFYSSLRLFPSIKTLVLESDEIQHHDQYPCSLTRKKLNNATIIGSHKMSSTFLQFLERLAPNLQYLTLKDCRLKSTEQPNSQYICMTNTHFAKLSIITESFSAASNGNYFTCVDTRWEKKLSSKADALLLQIKMVSSKEFPVQHFLLKPGKTASCAPISQDHYNKNVDTWLVMIIECKSLELLQFDLGALALDMTFGANGELVRAVSKTIVF